MIIRKLRLKKGWSQSQLAEIAGVTTRTIQRIEQGNKPSMETCRALAAVFEVDLSQLQPEEEAMLNEADLKFDEQEALAYAKRIKEFYEYLITYLALAAVFLITMYDEPLVWVVFIGIGIGVVVQGLIAYEVISFMKPNWEKRIAEKRLGRKL